MMSLDIQIIIWYQVNKNYGILHCKDEQYSWKLKSVICINLMEMVIIGILILLYMKQFSQTLSPQSNTQKITQITREISDLPPTNFPLKKQTSLTIKPTSLYYQNIPMSKQLPHWNQSTATLRNSSTLYRFSKEERFATARNNYQDSQQINIPSSLGKRSSSFGLGNKVKIPDVFLSGKNQASQQCPDYDVGGERIGRSTSSVSLRKGKSFGLGWKHYQASRTPHRATVHSNHQVRQNPAPNHYNLNPQLHYSYKKFKVHGRLEMFTTLNATYRLNQPNPQSYILNQNLTKPNERSTSLGIGNKVDFTKLSQRTPGPIYRYSSFCDKFTHVKLKLSQK